MRVGKSVLFICYKYVVVCLVFCNRNVGTKQEAMKQKVGSVATMAIAAKSPNFFRILVCKFIGIPNNTSRIFCCFGTSSV